MVICEIFYFVLCEFVWPCALWKKLDLSEIEYNFFY